VRRVAAGIKREKGSGAPGQRLNPTQRHHQLEKTKDSKLTEAGKGGTNSLSKMSLSGQLHTKGGRGTPPQLSSYAVVQFKAKNAVPGEGTYRH